MKRRYAVVAGIALSLPVGGAIAASDTDVANQASASWATMDANADGALTPEEVAATPWEDKFDAMDANGDGKVTKEEFGAYMKAMKKTQEIEKSGENSDT